MDKRTSRNSEHVLVLCAESSNKHHSLQAFASARSVIVNPSSSGEAVSCIFETLIQSLHHDRDDLLLNHLLKLLSDIALHRKDLSHTVFNAVHGFAMLCKDAPRLAAEALVVLVAIAEHDRSLLSSMAEFSDGFVLSLCFATSISVRSWILHNAARFCIRPSTFATMMLGFTEDPYPYVRKAALFGLLSASNSIDFEGLGLIERCYDRAVELLLDMDECVRSASVHAVSEWGQMLITYDHGLHMLNLSDAVFVQLCFMARDMSLEVRVKTFVALGKIRPVSEDLLLQTLSKKVLGNIKEKKVLGMLAAKQYDLPASNAAGTFVHGLEDEFYEVRRLACRSLGMLIAASIQFASGALPLLMDLLNDYSMSVRLQTLETMWEMAKRDSLKVQEIHMHMFLGTLADSNALIRRTARKVLLLMKLPVLGMFKSSFDGLLTNLEIYPQDEADIFSVIFCLGKSHTKLAISFMKEFAEEIEPSHDGHLRFDRLRVAAYLVLAIAASFSDEQHVCKILPRIFSYAVPWLGRICRALGDIIDEDSLLAYLSHCNKLMAFPSLELKFREEEPNLPVVESDRLSHNYSVRTVPVMFLQQVSNGEAEIQFQNTCDRRQVPIPLERKKLHEEAMNSLKLIIETASKTWCLMQSGCMSEVLRTLRCCRENLAIIMTDSLRFFGELAFASQYLHVIKLLANAWEHFLPPRLYHSQAMAALDLQLEKLERSLRAMRYRFMGLSKEEELHVMELILLSCMLRFSKLEICCHLKTLKRMFATISYIELLCEGRSIQPSSFIIELKKSLCQMGPSIGASDSSFLFKSLKFFSLKPVVFGGKIKHLRAEMDVPGNDSENPLIFVPGLPVGVKFDITLYNVTSENRLWLRMALDDGRPQYVFLGLDQFEGCDVVRKVTFITPFYRTPRAASFSLRACIGLECLFDDVNLIKGQGGPKHELTFICKEKEVYLVHG